MAKGTTGMRLMPTHPSPATATSRDIQEVWSSPKGMLSISIRDARVIAMVDVCLQYWAVNLGKVGWSMIDLQVVQVEVRH